MVPLSMSAAGIADGFPVPSAFAEQVLEIVDEIPPGRVLTYGDVAQRLDTAARAVGQVMANWGAQTCWHRVVRFDGRPASSDPARAMALLRADACPLAPTGDRVDLVRARWAPAGTSRDHRSGPPGSRRAGPG